MTRELTGEAAYHELCGYTLGLQDPAFIHQHVVDAHAAQTADERTKPITLAFALVGLHLHLERQFSGREVQLAHMRLAKQRRPWPRFALPGDRGALTAADALAAPAGAARAQAIDAWCASVWRAFDDSHQAVAELLSTCGII